MSKLHTGSLLKNAALGNGRLLLYTAGAWPYHVAFETSSSYVSHSPDKSSKLKESKERVILPELSHPLVVTSTNSFFNTQQEDLIKYGKPTSGLVIPNLNTGRIKTSLGMRVAQDRESAKSWQVETNNGNPDLAVRYVCMGCRYRLAGDWADNCITTALMLMAEGLPRDLQHVVYDQKILRELSNTQIPELSDKIIYYYGDDLQISTEAQLDVPIGDVSISTSSGQEGSE